MTDTHAPETLARMQWGLHRLAETIGDPDAARRLAEIADGLTPRPGPSKSTRNAKAARDRILRNYRRRHLSGLSDSKAAEEILKIETAYRANRLRHDKAAGREPVNAIEMLVFEADRDDRAFPGFDRLRLILAAEAD